MQAESNFVHVQGLSKSYPHPKGSLEVLKELEMEVKAGEFVSIVGPSGAGKTSLLRILAGFLPFDTGQVQIDGCLPEQYREESGIGFVFQKPLLFPWRNLRKNLMLPFELDKQTRSSMDKDRCDELLELFGLSEYDSFYPKQLSGGMLQRAAVARALMKRPKLLLLDEPFSAVDEITREQLWIDFHRIWKQEKITAILVTHSLREAAFLSDRVCVMSSLPGKLSHTVEVPLPGTRGAEALTSAELYETTNLIRAKLHGKELA